MKDPDASLKFYQAMFGVTEYFRDAGSIQMQGPGNAHSNLNNDSLAGQSNVNQWKGTLPVLKTSPGLA